MNTVNEQSTKLFEESPLIWGQVFFPHHFRVQSPTFHLKILSEAEKNLFLVVGAPRESSKTTLLAFLYVLHRLTFKKKRFIIIITSVYTKSCGALDAIKFEVKNNEFYRYHYPIDIIRDAEGDSIFRFPDGFQARILCKGRDQVGDIRGEKFGAYRPDLILIDDIEDDKMVQSPERRQELEDLFDQVIMFAGEKGVTQIIVIGTVLHDDGQLAKLLSLTQYKQFRKLLYRGRYRDKEGNKKSLWNEKWTVDDLDKMEQKNPVSFAKEIQNDPVSGAMAKFDRRDFRRWTIENMQYVLYGSEGEVVAKGDLINCRAAIACDLAWEQKRESDFSVILPAFLTPNAELLVETYFCKKGMKPDEIEEILFTMENRLRSITGHSVYIGFEKAKLEKVMKWLLREAMKRRNHYLLFKDLMWDADKITRIVTRLQPRYAQHVIYHKSGMGDLEHQLLRIPSGVHDDLPDALQGVVQLLEYPRHIPKQKEEESEFNWWRRQAIEAKQPRKKHFIFGSKGKRFEIPAKQSYR